MDSSRDIIDDNRSHGPLYAVEMGERDDVPCFIKVYFWPIPEQGRESEVSDGCYNGPTSRSLERVGYPTSQVRPRSMKALRGLQVCSNDRNGDNYRVKGLRVFAARLTDVDTGDSGRVAVRANQSADDVFERNHCRKWEQRRICPSGQMMVDIEIHYGHEAGPSTPGDERGQTYLHTRREITGLAPICAAMTFVDS